MKLNLLMVSIQYRRDYLGADIVRTIKRIKDFTPYTFQGHEPLTTIAWDNYGTTTMMAVIMIYNGILHPLEMIPGSIIKLPNISELERKLLQRGIINNIGKTVVI
jgi:hypothetical protein